MEERERELVKKFKSLLSQRLGAGFELFVFGSRVRGDADDESDLDVLVITQEPETYELLMTVSGCAWEAGLGSRVGWVFLTCPFGYPPFRCPPLERSTARGVDGRAPLGQNRDGITRVRL